MRSTNLARRLCVVLTATCLLGASAQQALAAPPPARVPGTQPLAVLLTAHRAYSAPALGSPQKGFVPARRPITGEQTTLPVVGRAVGARATAWLKVMLPGRPNGSTGWITARGTQQITTKWRLIVDLALRRVVAYHAGRVARTFSAVVGKPATPTPTGRFFVEETLRMTRGEPGGPYALALSGRSDVLQEFEGGPGQIALHGRDNLGGVLGAAESHGCMRVSTASIDWLISHIEPGTTVTITPG